MRLRSATDKRGFRLHVLPALLYVAFIFWLGSIHMSVPIPHGFLPQDKVEHCGAFGLLAWLVLRALRFELVGSNYGRLIVASIGVSSVIGALLEVWQAMLPHRTAEVGDWVADTIGALLAGLVSHIWFWWRARHVATG